VQHETLFKQLQAAAEALRAGGWDIRAFAQSVNDAAPLIASLPSVYECAMSDVVTRLDSATMFAGESCSFSQTDLYNALDTWFAKAEQKLAND
jgi:hypothetical protein